MSLVTILVNSSGSLAIRLSQKLRKAAGILNNDRFDVVYDTDDHTVRMCLDPKGSYALNDNHQFYLKKDLTEVQFKKNPTEAADCWVDNGCLCIKVPEHFRELTRGFNHMDDDVLAEMGLTREDIPRGFTTTCLQ